MPSFAYKSLTKHTNKPMALRSDEDFTRYASFYAALCAGPDAEDVARAVAGKHCAGRLGRVDGAAMLRALNTDPDPNDESSRAVRWMLSSIMPHECVMLITRCGVRPQALARHVRERPVLRKALVRFLNQFAIEPA